MFTAYFGTYLVYWTVGTQACMWQWKRFEKRLAKRYGGVPKPLTTTEIVLSVLMGGFIWPVSVPLEEWRDRRRFPGVRL